MATLGRLIRRIAEEESSRMRLIEGTLDALGVRGEHVLSVSGQQVVGRSVTDENLRVGDQVTLLMTGSDVLILGGRH